MGWPHSFRCMERGREEARPRDVEERPLPPLPTPVVFADHSMGPNDALHGTRPELAEERSGTGSPT